MDVVSRRISLTAWGRLYGFDKGTTSRLHHTGKLPPELQIEQLHYGRYYVGCPENDGRCVVYARFLRDQREDLDRQVGRVVGWATQQGCRPDEIVKEVGSGLTGNRRGLRRLVSDHTVSMIVVEHRDRLCRFGFEYIEAALSARGARILVMDESELEDDLVRDVTEVMTSLCARLYGRRSARRRAERALPRPVRAMKSTFQSRISEYLDMDRGAGYAALSAYAELYGRVERSCSPRLPRGTRPPR